LSDGRYYTSTHGRQEFVETYPVWTRALLAVLGRALALFGRTIAAFRREQYVFVGAESRSHVLLMNLSNVVNRIRLVASRDGRRRGRGRAPAPRGQRLVQPLPRGRRTARSGGAALAHACQVASPPSSR